MSPVVTVAVVVAVAAGVVCLVDVVLCHSSFVHPISSPLQLLYRDIERVRNRKVGMSIGIT